MLIKNLKPKFPKIKYVSIGVGASIKPGVRLGEGSVIGVGAAVIKDVNPGDVVVGVPAKPII